MCKSSGRKRVNVFKSPYEEDLGGIFFLIKWRRAYIDSFNTNLCLRISSEFEIGEIFDYAQGSLINANRYKEFR